jgi:hypothetical protein
MANPTIPFRVERRAWVRLPSDKDVRCQEISQTPHSGWLGKVRNVSRGGIGFVSKRRILPGTELLIELVTNTGELRRLLVRTVYTRLEKNGRWITGCAFASTLISEELQSFIRETKMPDQRPAEPGSTRAR